MKRLLYAAVLITAAFFFSCAKKSSGTSVFLQKSEATVSADEELFAQSSFTGTGYNPDEADDAASDQIPVRPEGRKVIFTGSVSLEVDSLEKTQAAVQKWAGDFGGYISESSMSARDVSFTVRIPSASFEKAMEQASSFGTVLRKNIQSTDVTDEFYDLKTRLETKRLLVDRLQNYLKNASSIKDMMEIETKLNDVTGDLESMQGQMNRLSGRIDFATVEISARLPANHTEEGFAFPDAAGRAKALFGGLLDFLVGLVFVLLYVVFYGVPVLLVLALFYWLCFGKIGLVRRLFGRVSGRKNKKQETAKQ